MPEEPNGVWAVVPNGDVVDGGAVAVDPKGDVELVVPNGVCGADPNGVCGVDPNGV